MIIRIDCNFKILIISIIFILLVPNACRKDDNMGHVEADLEIITDNLLFAEGPAYLKGDLYFTDILANKIYRWNETEKLQLFRENSGGANGLYFDKKDNLIVCEGANKRIVSIGSGSNTVTISDKFGNNLYNEPNDVWISPDGNIYFTDPVFNGTLSQDGEHVYCVQVSNGNTVRVIDDLVKPNGITGNTDGSNLYVADYGASRIYKYSILPDGMVSDKKLFAEVKADGLDCDNQGNIYAAGNGIMILNSSGQLINTIQVPNIATNTCIVDEGIKTIFISTHSTIYRYINN